MWFDLVEGFAVVAAVGLYLLPTFVAIGRDARDLGNVFAMDMLLGWTLIGWVAAFVWACRCTPREENERA